MNIVTCTRCGVLYDGKILEESTRLDSVLGGNGPVVFWGTGKPETFAPCKVCGEISVFLRESTEADLEETGHK